MSYIATPATIFKQMSDMSEAEYRITMALVYVCAELEGKAKWSDLEDITGMSRGGVDNGIKAAMERGIFKKNGRSKWAYKSYPQPVDSLPSRLNNDQNSLPSRLNENSNSLPSRLNDEEIVYPVDQNSLPSRLSTGRNGEFSLPRRLNEGEPILHTIHTTTILNDQEEVVVSREREDAALISTNEATLRHFRVRGSKVHSIARMPHVTPPLINALAHKTLDVDGESVGLLIRRLEDGDEMPDTENCPCNECRRARREFTTSDMLREAIKR